MNDVTQHCLWKFHWDCGRQGDLYGIFVATQTEIDSLIGSEVYFGSVLGKHSEIYGEIDESDITLISDDPMFVQQAINNGVIIGYNPFYYLPEEDE